MEQFVEPSMTSTLSGYRARMLCAAVAALVIATGGVLVALRLANSGAEPDGQNWWLVAWFVVAMAYSVAGTALLLIPTRRTLGGLFVVVGAAAVVSAVATQYLAFEASERGRPRWTWLAEADAWARPLGAAVLVALVPFELLPLAWRAHRWVRVARAGGVAGIAVMALDLAVGWRVVAATASGAVGLLGWQWWRQRAASTDPLPAWIFAGAVVAWLAVVPDSLDVAEWQLSGRHVVSALLLMGTVPLLVVGTIVDVVRRAPSGFEHASHRSVEWLLLAAGIALVYTGLVAGLGRLVGGSGPTWLLVAATGVIALAIEPARQRVRRLVDRLVYGSRDDPLSVVQRVVDHVGTDSGDDLLPALVLSLERELRLDAIAIDIAVPGGWTRAASIGPDTPHQRVVPLRHRDDVVGRLVVGWANGPSMRARDEEILDQLAGPLSLAVSWVRLAAELRRAGVAVVSAREEERRRLRRDLHDGLGPALTGVSLGLRTAIRQLERESSGSTPHVLLGRLADEVDAVVLELKQIVRDLRPTALDQLGLAGAVAEFTRKFDHDLEIHLALPAGPAPLPAAVEVAVYRIVTEALTNVVRHAHATRCWLTIATGDIVEIDVIDDGVGINHHMREGVGVMAMRERAAELGGAVRIAPNRPCGTHVHVQLPAVLP
jgi:signal transduction histidine kinase